jgi:hypothetical protein
MPTFDIDIRDPEAAAAVEELVRQRFDERGTVLVRIGNAPKRAIPFRTNTPFKKIQISFDVPKGHPEEKLELLGDGQQVVAFGIHPDTGKPYQWFGGEPGEIPLHELPLITEDEAKQLVNDAAELLAQFGYNRRGKKKKANGDDDKLNHLLKNIHDGHELHDSLRDAAAVLVAAGMADQAVVTKLRSAMETSKPPRDTRWQDRYDEIEKLVISAQEKFGTNERLAEMNEKFCIVPFGGKAVILMFEEVERPHGSGKRHRATFFQAGDFKLLFDNQKVKPGGKLGLASWWLSHKDRRQYAGVTFRPGQGPVINGQMNLWRGWGVEPKAGDWSLMHRHVVEVLAGGNESYANYILNWTAWGLQNPGRMAEVALVFKGKKGVGKGAYVRALLDIFGQHGLHISSMKQLTGQFNAHLMDCALLFADEAYWPGDKSAEGTLKHIITEPQIAIEKKRYDITSADNVLKLIMAGNEDWQVPASMDERRYAVFEVSSTYAGNREYFVPLFKQTFEDGGLQAMMFDLLHRDLGDWHPRYDVPQTAALQEQKGLSLKPEDQWWLHLLETGTLPHNSLENPRRARSQALNDAAKRDIPGLKFYSPHKLGRALRQRGCTACEIDHNRAWEFPPLAAARAKFDSDMGGSCTDWSDQEDWQVEAPVWANDATVIGYLHKESSPKDGHQGACMLSRDANEDNAAWFPKSQIKLRHLSTTSTTSTFRTTAKDRRVEITPTAWFAEKEEWKTFTGPEPF